MFFVVVIFYHISFFVLGSVFLKVRKNMKLGGGVEKGKVYDQNILYEKPSKFLKIYIHIYAHTIASTSLTIS